MKVKQIYELVNSVTSEILGRSDIINEDLSNVVDAGKEIFDATDVDNYVRSLVNHIGKVVFVNRPYSGSIPSILMDSWDFGSVLEKISTDLPEAEENESWELQDGAIYENQQFYKVKATAKFYNSKVTFEIPVSFAETQVKESFSSASKLNAFMSMILTAVENSMTIKIDGLITRTVTSIIAETIHADYPNGNYSTFSGIKAVNLLKLYNDRFGTQLTADTAITNADFLKFASYQMALYIDRLKKMSTLFNVEGKERFTSGDWLTVVLLSEFAKAADSYLQSDTFHQNYTALPNAETVPYWSGSGKSYNFADTSKIDVKTPSGDTVTVSGILGVMFDRDACAVCNHNRRVTTAYNAKGEFYNNFYKFDCMSLIAKDENCVVFFVA